MAQNHFKLNLIKTANALSCDEGGSGMKIPITKIEIKSNANFNAEYPKNSLLNDLIIIKVVNDNYELVLNKLNDIEFANVLPPGNYVQPNFYIAEKPTMDLIHKLTIKIYKINGEIVTAESEKIVWE